MIALTGCEPVQPPEEFVLSLWSCSRLSVWNPRALSPCGRLGARWGCSRRKGQAWGCPQPPKHVPPGPHPINSAFRRSYSEVPTKFDKTLKMSVEPANLRSNPPASAGPARPLKLARPPNPPGLPLTSLAGQDRFSSRPSSPSPRCARSLSLNPTS